MALLQLAKKPRGRPAKKRKLEDSPATLKPEFRELRFIKVLVVSLSRKLNSLIRKMPRKILKTRLYRGK
jgi:hypothetical protein